MVPVEVEPPVTPFTCTVMALLMLPTAYAVNCAVPLRGTAAVKGMMPVVTVGAVIVNVCTAQTPNKPPPGEQAQSVTVPLASELLNDAGYMGGDAGAV